MVMEEHSNATQGYLHCQYNCAANSTACSRKPQSDNWMVEYTR